MGNEMTDGWHGGSGAGGGDEERVRKEGREKGGRKLKVLFFGKGVDGFHHSTGPKPQRYL